MTRRLIESTLVSMDGVVEAPWEWVGEHFDEESREYSMAKLAHCDAFVLGRGAYEKFAGSWGQLHGDPYIDTINAMPKHVVSTTLRETTWNATLLAGDPVEEIRKLKSQPGRDLIKYGTSQLDRTLVRHGLVDEYEFLYLPVIVGKGRRLFSEVDPAEVDLRLVRTTSLKNGTIVATYVPE
ncbi:dihydrofolate reductase family protein [Fodinicola acaciae]|uniref:dihydrofolate reductase family protein n=1 Tax=Fodinicola acaciae TaxID=2681555 RepID=UPI0013D19038|nr:dihydrofolate reductase family protein [Fodinicola acaciae]